MALPVLTYLVGCTGVSYSDDHSKPRVENIDGNYKRVLVTNYGYYLFNWIPLGSGGSTDTSFELFGDNVNLKDAMQTLNDECAKLGATEISDLHVSPSSTCFFTWCPFFGTSMGIYWYKEIQVSATIATGKEALKNGGENE